MWGKILNSYSQNKKAYLYGLGIVLFLLLGYILYPYFTKSPNIVENKPLIDYKKKELELKLRVAKDSIMWYEVQIQQLQDKIKEKEIVYSNIKTKYDGKKYKIINNSADADFRFFSKWLSEADTIRK